MKSILTFFLFLLISSVVSGQLSPKDYFMQTSDWESWENKRLVNGELQGGIRSSIDKHKLLSNSFFVQLPKELAKNSTLCASIFSRDGRYVTSAIEFDISEKTGVLELLWPTRYFDELKTFRSDEITIKATIAENCGESNNDFIVAGWDSLSFLNSKAYFVALSNVEIFLEKFNPSSQEITDCPCIEIDDDRFVAYNWFCEFDLEDITRGYEFSLIQRRKTAGKPKLHPYPLSIKLK